MPDGNTSDAPFRWHFLTNKHYNCLIYNSFSSTPQISLYYLWLEQCFGFGLDRWCAAYDRGVNSVNITTEGGFLYSWYSDMVVNMGTTGDEKLALAAVREKQTL